MPLGLGGFFDRSESRTKGEDISPWASLAASIASQVEKETDPLRQKFLNLLLQVVTQGGSAVNTPISNQATAAGLQATSQATGDAATDLARTTGGKADPVTAAILGSIRQQGLFATSAIPSQMGQSMFGMVPGAISSSNDFISRLISTAVGGSRYFQQSGVTTNWGGGGSVSRDGTGGGAGGGAGAQPVNR